MWREEVLALLLLLGELGQLLRREVGESLGAKASDSLLLLLLLLLLSLLLRLLLLLLLLTSEDLLLLLLLLLPLKMGDLLLREHGGLLLRVGLACRRPRIDQVLAHLVGLPLMVVLEVRLDFWGGDELVELDSEQVNGQPRAMRRVTFRISWIERGSRASLTAFCISGFICPCCRSFRSSGIWAMRVFGSPKTLRFGGGAAPLLGPGVPALLMLGPAPPLGAGCMRGAMGDAPSTPALTTGLWCAWGDGVAIPAASWLAIGVPTPTGVGWEGRRWACC